MIQLQLTETAPSEAGPRRNATSIPFGVDRYLHQALHRPVQKFLLTGGKRIRASVIEIGFRLGQQQPISRCLPAGIIEFIELLHAGSLIIDDVQDQSTCRRNQKSMHEEHGIPIAVNTGNWMYFAALEKLMEVGIDDAQRLSILSRALGVIKTCHEGQALDLFVSFHKVPQHELPEIVEKISDWKTGALTELAAWLGAIANGASPATSRTIGEFGKQLGVALQMQNDLRELQQTAAGLIVSEDLSLRRATWCWAWLSISLPAQEYQRRVRMAVSESYSQQEIAKTLLEPIEITAGNEINLKLQQAAAEIETLIWDEKTRIELNQLLSSLECRYA